LIDMAVTCRDKNLVNILLKRNIVDPKPDNPKPHNPVQPISTAKQAA